MKLQQTKFSQSPQAIKDRIASETVKKELPRNKKNVASLQFGAKRNSGIFVTDEKRKKLERDAQLLTTN